jgi:NADH:ubiquinone oxidoreductase subunit 2 (subunit N)
MDYVNDLVTILPELILAALVLVIITVDLFLPRTLKWLLTPLTVGGLVLAGAACVVVWDVNEEVYAGFYVVDDLSVFFKAATIVVGILSTLFAPSYLQARRIPLGEFNTILVTALIGMCVLA